MIQYNPSDIVVCYDANKPPDAKHLAALVNQLSCPNQPTLNGSLDELGTLLNNASPKAAIALIKKSQPESDAAYLARLRALPNMQRIPIILLANEIEGANSQTGYAEGIDLQKHAPLRDPQGRDCFAWVTQYYRDAAIQAGFLSDLYGTNSGIKLNITEWVKGFAAKTRFMLAEDESTITHLLVSSLEQNFGLSQDNICKTNDGYGALEAYKKEPRTFNMVFTDYDLLNINGDELTKAIRNEEMEQKLSPIPIICLTGSQSKQHIIKNMLDAGIDSIFTKPYCHNDLMKMFAVAFAQYAIRSCKSTSEP